MNHKSRDWWNSDLPISYRNRVKKSMNIKPIRTAIIVISIARSTIRFEILQDGHLWPWLGRIWPCVPSLSRFCPDFAENPVRCLSTVRSLFRFFLCQFCPLANSVRICKKAVRYLFVRPDKDETEVSGLSVSLSTDVWSGSRYQKFIGYESKSILTQFETKDDLPWWEICIIKIVSINQMFETEIHETKNIDDRYSQWIRWLFMVFIQFHFSISQKISLTKINTLW